MAGREVDLTNDPPPDLVVEIDITHTDIDKLSLYAAMGVTEFWRFDGERLRIYMLEKAAYKETETSATFPQVSKDRLYEFLAECKLSEVEASRNLRQWLRNSL